jgi:hypothetical protein
MALFLSALTGLENNAAGLLPKRRTVTFVPECGRLIDVSDLGDVSRWMMRPNVSDRSRVELFGERPPEMFPEARFTHLPPRMLRDILTERRLLWPKP